MIALCLCFLATVPLRARAADEAAVCKAYREDAQAPAPAHTPPQPFGKGLLWRLTRSGAPASYIFGTMHVDTPLLTRLPDPVRHALAASKRLVMETQLDAQAQAVYSTRAFLPDNETLKPLLRPPLVDAYLRFAADAGLPADTAIRLTPWAATNLIGRPLDQNLPTMEDVLRTAARRAGKPIDALESMTELLDTLSAMPIADQMEILTDTICNHDRILRETDTLEEIYQRRDLAGLMAFNNREHRNPALFARFRQRMLFDRSKRMVERMLPYLAQGGAFVAVGALHLTGKRGILQMLKERGFDVTAEY